MITNPEIEIEINYFLIYSLFIGLFSIFSIIIGTGKKEYIKDIPILKFDILVLTKLFVISVFLVLIYFYLVGENLFYEGMKSLLETGQTLTNVTNRRFAFYSGKKYYAPGFFNLFKNFLLPISFFSIIIMKKKGIINISKLTMFILWVLFLLLILGTGQRGAFVFSFFYAFLISYQILGKEKTKVISLSLGAILFFIFVISTFFLARNKYAQYFDLETFRLLLNSVLDRFFVTNQFGALAAYKYVVHHETTQWGYDWLMSLGQLLPGKPTYINLDHKVFQEMYGSLRGTNPPSLVVSIYYNFGLLGIITLPFVLVILFNTLYMNLYFKARSYSDFVFYLLIYFALATWINGSILYPVSNGLILLPLIWIIKKRKLI